MKIESGDGTGAPLVKFKAKLSHAEKTPDMYMRLRVKDELAFLDDPNATSPTCEDPGTGGIDFWIPVSADSNGVYQPASRALSVTPPADGQVATVNADGFAVLDGVVSDRYYTLVLKAPKFRGTKEAEHVLLQTGSENQSFDWTEKPLEAGDLSDPNADGVQDCTVNSVDLSLIESRLGSTDSVNLDVADVNYDSVVNGNDLSIVVDTLSRKSDDDL